MLSGDRRRRALKEGYQTLSPAQQLSGHSGLRSKERDRMRNTRASKMRNRLSAETLEQIARNREFDASLEQYMQSEEEYYEVNNEHLGEFELEDYLIEKRLGSPGDESALKAIPPCPLCGDSNIRRLDGYFRCPCGFIVEISTECNSYDTLGDMLRDIYNSHGYCSYKLEIFNESVENRHDMDSKGRNLLTWFVCEDCNYYRVL